MNKKNVGLATVLGFFVLPIFYSAGALRGVFTVAGAMVVAGFFAYILPEGLAWLPHTIVALVCAFLGRKWALEHNEQIEAQQI